MFKLTQSVIHISYVEGKRRRAVAWCLAMTLLFAASYASAEEGGSTEWPLGVQTVVPALVPPPGGTQFYNYTLYYDANRVNDANGNKASPSFHLQVMADAARVVHTWETTIAGVNLSSAAIVAGNYLDLSVPGASDHASGLNYVYLTPLYLSYQLGNAHFLFGPSVLIPTGGFNANNLVSPSYNYYSYDQEIALTYLPSPSLEISAATTITVSGTNPATHYRSGAMVDTDFAMNYAPIPAMPNVQFGVTGFYAQQFQDDTLNGVTFEDGNRLKKIGVGLQAIYYFSRSVGVALKWQREVVARNTPQGDRLWLEVTCPL